jgi:hypothetical protein
MKGAPRDRPYAPALSALMLAAMSCGAAFTIGPVEVWRTRPGEKLPQIRPQSSQTSSEITTVPTCGSLNTGEDCLVYAADLRIGGDSEPLSPALQAALQEVLATSRIAALNSAAQKLHCDCIVVDRRPRIRWEWCPEGQMTRRIVSMSERSDCLRHNERITEEMYVDTAHCGVFLPRKDRDPSECASTLAPGWNKFRYFVPPNSMD